MSVYTARLFSKQNASIALRTGQALQANLSKLQVVDTGFGKPALCSENELIKYSQTSKSGDKVVTVGYLGKDAAGLGFAQVLSMISGSYEKARKEQMIPSLRESERLFVNMMAGNDIMKKRALARAKELLGCPSLGEDPTSLVIPPRSYRQMRVWVEIYKAWRYNKKVKGFILDRVRSGYAVAIAGYVAFLPRSLMRRKRITDSSYIFETINLKKKNFVVT